jgi:hypothetical protein
MTKNSAPLSFAFFKFNKVEKISGVVVVLSIIFSTEFFECKKIPSVPETATFFSKFFKI